MNGSVLTVNACGGAVESATSSSCSCHQKEKTMPMMMMRDWPRLTALQDKDSLYGKSTKVRAFFV